MKNGTSNFKYSILEDVVTLDVIIEWDEYGEGVIDEITIDDLDVTEEIIKFGLYSTLIIYAEENPEYFTSDAENATGY